MARNLNAKKRREIKSRKIEKSYVMEHQAHLPAGFYVRVLTLEEHFNDDTVFPVEVYKAPQQPIVEGYSRNSQTAVVMLALEKYGAENARL
jgi:hypothetical protein